MASKALKRCESLVKEAAKAGFTHQISVHSLNLLIKRDIGTDPRTLRNWIGNLEDFGFIKRINKGVYGLNLRLVEGALEIAVESGKQKKLV